MAKDTDDLILLDTICEQYFNVTPRIARHKAAMNTLPVPAFRLTNSGRGPLFVSRETLNAWIESRSTQACKLHKQVTDATA